MFSPVQQVTGSTLGIIGFGNIGKAVAEKAKGFKMEILYYSRTRKKDQEKRLGKMTIIILCQFHAQWCIGYREKSVI